MVAFVERFGTTKERLEILDGFLTFRGMLDAVVNIELQWVDGSFLEEDLVRAPRDIDVLTVFSTPKVPNFDPAAHSDLFVPASSKLRFKTDAHYVSINHPRGFCRQIAYWIQLFSHSRRGQIWKGMVELPPICADEGQGAQLVLERITALGSTP